MKYQIRLFFEPKTGTEVNHTKMFEHYVLNWLEGFDCHFGGFITMPVHEKIHGALEPVYQVIFDDPTEACKAYLNEYINRNPLIGYIVSSDLKELRRHLYALLGGQATS